MVGSRHIKSNEIELMDSQNTNRALESNKSPAIIVEFFGTLGGTEATTTGSDEKPVLARGKQKRRENFRS